MNQRVLDISAYQGEVDFQRVKRDGIWGVMLKATSVLPLRKIISRQNKPSWRLEPIII